MSTVKRKLKDPEPAKVEDVADSEDEALGKDLDLDRSDVDGDSDDSDSSEYSELEEDSEEDGEEEEEEDEGDDEDDEDESEVEDEQKIDEKGLNETEKETEVVEVVSKAVKSKKDREKRLELLKNLQAPGGNSGKPDEYAYDSSDEEDVRNTIGNIPVNWYDEYPHIGYDLDGKQIRKPKRGDELEAFLSKMENPNHGVTVDDPLTGQGVVLSEADADIARRLHHGKIPDASYNMYAEWSEWFTSDVMETPLRDIPETKASFLPSQWEKKKVSKMVHSLKMGWMKPRDAKTVDDGSKKFYMLWQTDDQVDANIRRIFDPIPAPKMKLPGHEESYNPPPEYLFTEGEKKEWERATEDGDRRKLPFIPQKYSCLRKVPAFTDFIKERFDRCMDLYLAPRARKMRLTIQPEDLVPQLPRPQDLQPFPTVNSINYKGHKNMVRSISMEPQGQYFISGSDDETCKIWEVSTGRCLKTLEVGGVVKCVAWCPNPALSLVAVAVDTKVLLINTGVGDKLVNERTTELLAEEPDNTGYVPPVRLVQAVKWMTAVDEEYPPGTLVVVNHFKPVKQVTWHGKGDYFAVVLPEGAQRSVMIHQLSKWRSQLPFSKSKGQVQTVLFHPIRPYLFVATQKHVRVYDLVKQELSKKLMTGSKWISSMSIHPGGDNLLVGTFDKKVLWFDLDLSSMPYQTLRYHTNALRAVEYHKRYPLFASAGDDRNITVSHGMVYSDLLQNPLIVPVKKLAGHTSYDDFGVMGLQWHPSQPWLLSAGADSYIKLWT